MPRRRSSIDSEVQRQIGSRLADFRRELRFSQSELAITLGLTRDQVANIESGRTALPYIVALKAHALYALSLDRLAGFPAPPKSEPYEWPLSPEPGILDEKSDFSTVARKVFNERPVSLARACSKFESDAVVRELGLGALMGMVEDLLAAVPEARIRETVAAVAARIEELRRNLPDRERSIVDSTKLRMLGFRASAHPDEGLLEEIERGNKRLTDVSVSADMSGVLSPMGELLARLNRATAARGAKARLAATLGVPRQSISDWLSGKIMPGGDTTLRLLNWVGEEERTQKSRGDARNIATAKAQLGNPNHEKTKSDPPSG